MIRSLNFIYHNHKKEIVETGLKVNLVTSANDTKTWMSKWLTEEKII